MILCFMTSFRHVAKSNLRNAGNSPTVIMKASGHKTMSMFIRYNLVDKEDLKGMKWIESKSELNIEDITALTTTTRWTGTDYDGSVTTQTCSEWTSSANSGRGTIANTAMAGNNYNFIYTGYAAGYPCDATRVLMCICY